MRSNNDNSMEGSIGLTGNTNFPVTKVPAVWKAVFYLADCRLLFVLTPEKLSIIVRQHSDTTV